MQRISITLDDNLKHQLDKVIPKGERAAFVSQAISNELEALKKSEAVTMLRNFKRHKVNKNSVDLVRKIRSERADYVVSRHGNDKDSDHTS